MKNLYKGYLLCACLGQDLQAQTLIWMTKENQYYEFDNSKPIPAMCYDGLIPRGVSLNTFSFSVDKQQGLVTPTIPPGNPAGLTFKYSPVFDENIPAYLNQPMMLDKQMESVVWIVIKSVTGTGDLRYTTGSGVLLSPRIVFTAEHLFRQPGKPDELLDFQEIHVGTHVRGQFAPISSDFKGMVKANKLSLPERITRLIDPLSFQSSDCVSWEQNFLDFCVLHLEEDMNVDSEKLLKIPGRPLHSVGSVVCSMGFPGRAVGEDSVASLMPIQLLKTVEMSNISKSTARSLYRNLYFSTMSNFESFIACIGAVCTLVMPERCAYESATFTSASGFSGGPVIALDNPEYLVGLVVGSRKSQPFNVMIDVHSPPILEAYQFFVLERA